MSKVYPLPDFGLNQSRKCPKLTTKCPKLTTKMWPSQLDHLISNLISRLVAKKIPKKTDEIDPPVQKIDRPSANSDSGAHLLRSREVRAGVRHHLLILVECYTCQSISITLCETYKKLWKDPPFLMGKSTTFWLVVSTYPSEKWWSESQLGVWHSHILWKIKNVWNHQPALKPCNYTRYNGNYS